MSKAKPSGAGSIEPFLRRLDGAVPLAGRRVLDIGCGDGIRTVGIARLAQSVVAVDPDRKIIATAKKSHHRKNISYHVASAAKLPFARADFDVVLFSMSFHHLREADMPRALREALRVLRPGGYLAFFEQDWAGTFYQAAERFGLECGTRAAKAYVYYMMLTEPGMIEIDESIHREVFPYRSVDDFVRQDAPQRGTKADWSDFLKRHRFRLTADHRLNIFQKR